MKFSAIKKHSPKLIISFVFLLGAVFLFAAIVDEVVLEKEQQVDLLIFEFFKANIIRNGLNHYMYSITHFCSTSFVQFAYPFLILLLLVFKYYKKAAFTFVAGVGGMILIRLLKVFFQRPRPLYPLLYKETGYSFPSGHATFSFILYGTLAYFVWLTDLPKALKLTMMMFLMMLSLSIGISRIYLMVHYPTDVVAGFCLGYSWLFLLIYFFRLKYPLHI